MSERTEYFLQVEEIRTLNVFEKGTLWKLRENNDYVAIGRPIQLELCPTPPIRNNLPLGVITREYNLTEFHPIDHLEFCLLLTIRQNDLRLRVFFDEDWMLEGKEMKVSDEVVILKVGDEINYRGKIRYRGPIYPPSEAISFGIELDPEFAGQGTTDGFFKGCQHFECEHNCGLFRNIGYVRLKNKKEKLQKQIPPISDISFPIATQTSSKMHYRKEDVLETASSLSGSDGESTEKETKILKVGDKVYWWSDSGGEPAIVKWVGYLPDGGEELVAGVEFFNRIGTGSGKYKQWKLFDAKIGHASLIPFSGLTRAEDTENPYEMKSKIRSKFDIEKLKLTEAEFSAEMIGEVKKVSFPFKSCIELRQPIYPSFRARARARDSKFQEEGRICKPVITTSDSLKKLCGEKKGIEVVTGDGDLEAIIYALFSFNESFDGEFSKELSLSQITTSIMLKRQLGSIVNKLRSNHYVQKTVMFLFAQNLAHFPMEPYKSTGLQNVFFHLIKSCFSSLMNNINITVLESFEGISSVQHALKKSFSPSLFLQNFSSIPMYAVFKQHSTDICVPSAFINPRNITFSCCKCNISISHPVESFPDKPRKGFLCLECGNGEKCRSALFCSDCFDHFHSSENNFHHTKKEIDKLFPLSSTGQLPVVRYKPKLPFSLGSFEHESSEEMAYRLQKMELFPADVPRRMECFDIDVPQKMELFAVISKVHDISYGTFVKTSRGENALWLGYEATPQTSRVNIFPEFTDFLSGYSTSPSGSFPRILHEMVNNMICCFYRPLSSSPEKI